MVSSFSFLVVTALALQAQPPSPPQTANGFRTTSIDKTPPSDPTKALTPEVRGDILMARKMYREAIEKYKEGPSDSSVLANKIGIAYHQLLDLESAKKNYERAIKLNPAYAEAINNLGTIHYARKSYRRAIAEYNKALKITPQSASILSNLGTAYFARKNYELAYTAYQKALQIDPEVFEHRSGHGVLLQERTVDERAKFHYFLAKACAKAGMNDQALIVRMQVPGLWHGAPDTRA